jgi:hypothetical protein
MKKMKKFYQFPAKNKFFKNKIGPFCDDTLAVTLTRCSGWIFLCMIRATLRLKLALHWSHCEQFLKGVYMNVIFSVRCGCLIRHRKKERIDLKFLCGV